MTNILGFSQQVMVEVIKIINDIDKKVLIDKKYQPFLNYYN